MNLILLKRNLNHFKEMELSTNKVEQLKQVFQKFKEIEKVVLYGSRVLGRSKPGSDVDLSLYGSIPYSIHLKIMNEMDEMNWPEKIDVSFYKDIQNKELREHIDHLGEVIYKKS